MTTDFSIKDCARRFSHALDAEDYESVRAMLASDCVYVTRTGTLVGPDDIVNSYRDSATLAHQLFESVTFTSEIQRVSRDQAWILFVDHIRNVDRNHTFRCRQRLRFSTELLIRQITHEEIPNQRQELLEFCRLARISERRLI